MPVKIRKSSGSVEEFESQKLINSLVRSGAPVDVAHEISAEIEARLTSSTNTRDIYRKAKRLLRQYNRASGMRYSFKKAIFALGPSGYPFEKYFGRVLRHYGYEVGVNKIIKGYCVSHEVDVVAKANGEWSLIECKYHSDAGKATDIKTALYVHSRYLDVKRLSDTGSGNDHPHLKDVWLVTNTRCTLDAVRYAECMGIKIVSWKYPGKASLEKMIEDRRLYPVTILNSLKRGMLDSLFSADIILAQDIAEMSEKDFISKSGLDEQTALLLRREALEVCPCS